MCLTAVLFASLISAAVFRGVLAFALAALALSLFFAAEAGRGGRKTAGGKVGRWESGNARFPDSRIGYEMKGRIARSLSHRHTCPPAASPRCLLRHQLRRSLCGADSIHTSWPEGSGRRVTPASE